MIKIYLNKLIKNKKFDENLNNTFDIEINNLLNDIIDKYNITMEKDLLFKLVLLLIKHLKDY